MSYRLKLIEYATSTSTGQPVPSSGFPAKLQSRKKTWLEECPEIAQ